MLFTQSYRTECAFQSADFVLTGFTCWFMKKQRVAVDDQINDALQQFPGG